MVVSSTSGNCQKLGIPIQHSCSRILQLDWTVESDDDDDDDDAFDLRGVRFDHLY
jgi:hypothetical protein